MAAYQNESLEVLKYLVEEGGAEFEGRDSYQETCFLSACRNKNVQILKYLIERKSDVSVKNKDEQNALHLASLENKNLHIIQFLIEQAEHPPFNQTTKVKEENRKSWDINEEDVNGNTALLLLNQFTPHLHTTKYLLEKGADLNHQNKGGNTVLHLSCFRKHYLFTLFLLCQEGCKRNLLNFSKKSAKQISSSEILSLFEEDEKNELWNEKRHFFFSDSTKNKIFILLISRRYSPYNRFLPKLLFRRIIQFFVSFSIKPAEPPLPQLSSHPTTTLFKKRKRNTKK